jgi:hypothetical protein
MLCDVILIQMRKTGEIINNHYDDSDALLREDKKTLLKAKP